MESGFTPRSTRNLKSRLQKIWLEGGWGRDQQRHYHALYGLQILKRLIYRDKIYLTQWAFAADIHKGTSEEKRHNPQQHHRRAKFMVVRAGVYRSLDEYIQRLRDFQSAYNKAVDTGQQDYPGPITERRRELGIYMDFLSERSRDILRDMRLMLRDEFKLEPKFGQSALIFHRWGHDFRSMTYSLDDEIYRHDQANECEPRSYRFVNTSYFMPERPDIQPIIAHEVAHDIVDHYWDNFSAIGLGSARDSFSLMMADIQTQLSNFHQWPGFEISDHSWIKSLMIEISCDLLAASVKGLGFVYAEFLELTTSHLDQLLVVEGGRRDLSIVEHLEVAQPTYLLRRQWYLRLKLIIAWIRATKHSDDCKLDDKLLDGVDHIAEEINDLLNSLVVGDYRSEPRKWKYLTDKLVHTVTYSNAARRTKNWREARSKSETPQPRSMDRLDWQTRNLLYKIQLNLKLNKNRKLRNILDENGIKIKNLSEKDAQKNLEKAYSIRHVLLKGEKGEKNSPMYGHLYDIPWQSALMRAMDVLDANKRNKKRRREIIFREITYDFALGRGLFEVALEFFLRKSVASPKRLASVIALISDYIPQLEDHKNNKWAADGLNDDDSIKKLISELKGWLGEAIKKSTEDKFRDMADKSLRELSIDFDEKHLSGVNNRLTRKSNKYTARQVMYMFARIGPGENNIYKTVDLLAGIKLRQLYDILDEKAPYLDRERSILLPLIRYLEIRKDDDSKNHFFKTLEKCLAKRNTLGTDGPNKIDPLELNTSIIGRIRTAGSYDIQKYKNCDSPFVLTNFLSGPSYHHNSKPELDDSDTRQIHYTGLLGRFDMLIRSETRHVCRCRLPMLPNRKSVTKEENDRLKDSQDNGLFDCPDFPTFMSRREMALGIDIHGTGNGIDEKLKKPILAIIAVTLQKRIFRMDFLYRLAITLQKGKKDVANPRFPEDLHSKFIPNDYAYLTDGWGDILIMLVDNDDKTRDLKEIYSIQNALFQDFMVDRTELIFTELALDRVPKDLKDFRIVSHLRMMEDRSPSPSNELFESEFKSPDPSPKLRRMPGRMDYCIEYINPSQRAIATPADNIFLELVRKGNVDRVDTYIELRIPEE